MDNWLPIEVCYPANGRARYALVLGSGGETYGLSLYDLAKDVRQVVTNPDPTASPVERNAWFSLVFEEATVMRREIFLGGPSHLYEFKRKVSDSKYAVASYKSTWRKLGRYVRSLGYGSSE